MYRFKNVWIRVNDALVIRNAETVYRTISVSQWYITTAEKNVKFAFSVLTFELKKMSLQHIPTKQNNSNMQHVSKRQDSLHLSKQHIAITLHIYVC